MQEAEEEAIVWEAIIATVMVVTLWVVINHDVVKENYSFFFGPERTTDVFSETYYL